MHKIPKLFIQNFAHTINYFQPHSISKKCKTVCLFIDVGHISIKAESTFSSVLQNSCIKRQKLLHSRATCLRSFKSELLDRLTNIEVLNTWFVLLLRRCFRIGVRSRIFLPAHSIHRFGYLNNRMASAWTSFWP